MNIADLLRYTEHGLYCPPGGFYVDPHHAVARAVITHAHGDHARAGHGSVLSYPVTAALLRGRVGGNFRSQPLQYGESVDHNGVSISLHPAGHVPGSAQVRLEYNGMVAVVSGDYKLENDGISTPFEHLRCHVFVTECTFGLPLFHWSPQQAVGAEISDWHAANQSAGRTSVLVAYALGKAQRLLGLLTEAGMRVVVHRSVAAVNAALHSAEIVLPAVETLKDQSVPALRGAVVIAPGSTLREGWLSKLAPASVAHVSGWMALRRFRRSRGGGMGFVLSDHADWEGLNTAVKASGADHILVTHGYDAAFSRWLCEQGYAASLFEDLIGRTTR